MHREDLIDGYMPQYKPCYIPIIKCKDCNTCVNYDGGKVGE